jgi:hypothetical protein
MLYSQRDSLLSSYVMVYIASYEGGDAMAMVKATDQRAEANQVKLDALRKEGTSASGFIRSLLEKEFKHRKETQS